MRWLLAQEVRGLVIATLLTLDSERFINQLLDESKVSVVMVGSNHQRTDSISADFAQGGLQATSHLIELGHSRIAFAGAEFSDASRLTRLQGYLDAFLRGGVQVRPQYVLGNSEVRSAASYSTRDTGRAVTEKLMKLDPPPTAIFARNDHTAFGVLDALNSQGIKVPEQVSVVGFDNIPLCRYVTPPLTTIAQPTTEQATLATEHLVERMRGKMTETGPRHVQLECSLVERRSTGPAPEA